MGHKPMAEWLEPLPALESQVEIVDDRMVVGSDFIFHDTIPDAVIELDEDTVADCELVFTDEPPEHTRETIGRRRTVRWLMPETA